MAYDPKRSTCEDLSTYWGRLLYFQNIITPWYNYAMYIRNIFYSKQTLSEYQTILDDVKANKPHKYLDSELWKMRYVVDANVNPDTRQIIPLPFRSSTLVPMNVPIVFILALMAPTFGNQIVGQTINQTYNFLFNYSNRNASNTFTNQQLAFSYGGAVTSAIVGSLGSAHLLKLVGASAVIQGLSPIAGVLVANSFNLYFSRVEDFKNGIDVYDAKTLEKLPNKSILAAQDAFWKTLAVRIATPLPVFILPKLMVHLMQSAKIYPGTRMGRLAANTLISASVLYCGLSGAIALFPQHVTVDASELEPEFEGLRNNLGERVVSIRYNKGI